MRVTVVLDEAQYLSGVILKDLQMLVNFDMDLRDMFSLVLVGHPHLAQTLAIYAEMPRSAAEELVLS